jgi:hypothetical protein
MPNEETYKESMAMVLERCKIKMPEGWETYAKAAKDKEAESATIPPPPVKPG